MRALVTGAAGFVGSHLVDALVARGDTVVAVDSLTPYYDISQKRANAQSTGIELVEADLRTSPIEPLLDGVDVVFHQSAQPGVRLSWSKGFREYVEQNVLVTQRLLDAVHAVATPRFVYASSSSVYGTQLRYPTTETDLPAPFSPYGVTKLAAEHLCGVFAANWGLSTVSLRYFTVFGPRQRPDMSIHRLCEAAINGDEFPLFGDGSQIREFTYVSDIVAGNLAAADADVAPGTIVNLAGGAEITISDLISLVESIAGAPIAVDRCAAEPGDSRRNGGAIDRARELLGWEPKVSLRDGIAAQLEWHRARN
ncbi:MAG TPA: NAD-dependent epimerase/dehydratase family protein [Acidimicrobiia bacterium]|nr:NAD-dependent epimerase/dehydratase family protein [Acidimicrobiia bacterium]